MRLVDADALKAKSFGKRGGLIHTSDIDAMPTVDVVQVVHGRWITHEVQINGYAHATCECTACGSSRPTTLFPLNYCPNCGAKMDGKDGDNETKV